MKGSNNSRSYPINRPPLSSHLHKFPDVKIRLTPHRSSVMGPAFDPLPLFLSLLPAELGVYGFCYRFYWHLPHDRCQQTLRDMVVFPNYRSGRDHNMVRARVVVDIVG